MPLLGLFNIVRKLCLSMVALGLLAPALVVAQPARPKPPTKPTKRMGFLLQIYDPEKLLKEGPLVNLVGSQGSGRTVIPGDKGSRANADVAAGDRIFSAPVPSFPDSGVTITIKSRSGSGTWSIKTTLDPDDLRALVFLKLLKGGKVIRTTRGTDQPRAPAAASGSKPGSIAPTSKGGFLLQLHDPEKLMKAPPMVTLRGMMGSVRMVQPKDSGKQVDCDAFGGDHIYSTPAPIFPGGVMTVIVQSKMSKWVIKVKLNARQKRPLVILRLQPNGRVRREAKAEVTSAMVQDVNHPGVPGKPGTALAPVTRGRPGFLLQIYDPKRYLKKPPRVTLRGSLGTMRVVIPQDSGKIQHSDVTKGDHVFSAPAPFFPDGVVRIMIKSERRKWSIKVKMEPEVAQALVFLQLFKGGKVEEVPRDVVGKPLPPGNVGLGRNLGEVRPVIPTVTRTTRPESQGSANLGSGFVLWALAFVTLGLGGAITLALTGRRPRGASRLAAPDGEPIVEVQLAAADVAAVLEGPLAEFRVVLLGEAPHSGAGIVHCLEENPLPDELVTAVERLAVSPGPPVALLVTDPELLDRAGPMDPVISLSKRVARRFPLWVVDGPEEWEGWPAGEQNKEENKEQRPENREQGTGENREQGTGENREQGTGEDGEQGTGEDGEQGTGEDGEPSAGEGE